MGRSSGYPAAPNGLRSRDPRTHPQSSHPSSGGGDFLFMTPVSSTTPLGEDCLSAHSTILGSHLWVSTASLRRASRPPGGNESLFDSGDLSRRVSESPPCPS